MNAFKTQLASLLDVSSLQYQCPLNVVLESNYIARGSVVASDQIAVWVLDTAQFTDVIRSQPRVSFEIRLPGNASLRGQALAEIGVSRTAQNNKRFVEVILTLEEASEVFDEAPTSRWLT